MSQAEQVIRAGSKSFSLASRLLGSRSQEGAYLLYHWCRWCDDQIDGAPDPGEAARRLEHLRQGTLLALGGAPALEPALEDFRQVAGEFLIPSEHALALLDGMAMDVRAERYETFEQLELYCYRVAGVVGLMLCAVFGVTDPAALVHAKDLGIAMQLTNIARDIHEDARLGRVYLPSAWLKEAGLPPSRILEPDAQGKLSTVVEKLLDLAAGYYASGRRGLPYLPWRAALSVAVAAEVYEAIGTRVRARGPRAWESRTVVSRWGKLRALVRGAGKAIWAKATARAIAEPRRSLT